MALLGAENWMFIPQIFWLESTSQNRVVKPHQNERFGPGPFLGPLVLCLTRFLPSTQDAPASSPGSFKGIDVHDEPLHGAMWWVSYIPED